MTVILTRSKYRIGVQNTECYQADDVVSLDSLTATKGNR